jgi:predicted NUDIX family NTP pyrophosphohydrolase
LKRSAGLLLFRYRSPDAELEVLVVHPGGPLFAHRGDGYWSVPKGEYSPEEEPLEAAIREFTEEVGQSPPPGDLLDLGEVRQRSGKLVRVYAVPGDLDAGAITSNEFDMEWPRGSGVRRRYPEVDRAAWVSPTSAKVLLNPAQAEFVDRLVEALEVARRD